ncbi:putative DNA polymerase IV [Megasphaera lornae]|uniref:DNA polymerase IV n=1 Tax=Megasphaera lornae TaxID=1000568 RepID=D3LSZ6_9FIRM|nr:DNA polymerase IV [Megasphaera genomosp. type_1]EFD94780.1 putative DNA polymerase IV [Megasphaera genomosp. type_1 str. 28L]
MQRRLIMHVDMDAFYASIEQRDRKELRGKPVIIGGLSGRGVVATASYEARRFGVHAAMSMREAHVRCPQGVFLSPRLAYYRRISQEIRTIFYEYSPVVEPLALDEAFLDISGMERQYPQVYTLARSIKERILRQTGLEASAGIGANKFLAKVASDLEKPNGLVVVPEGKEAAFLAPLPIRRLWGVGNVTAQALARAGFFFIGQVAQASVEDLQQVVGKQAHYLQLLANGKDARPVVATRAMQSIGQEHTYEEDLATERAIDENLRKLAYETAYRLRQQGVEGRTITLKIRFASFRTITRSFTAPMQEIYREADVYRISRRLYEKTARQEPIRLLGLTVRHLRRRYEQPSLFDEDTASQEKLAKTIDAVQRRFGKQALMKGLFWDSSQS